MIFSISAVYCAEVIHVEERAAVLNLAERVQGHAEQQEGQRPAFIYTICDGEGSWCLVDAEFLSSKCSVSISAALRFRLFPLKRGSTQVSADVTDLTVSSDCSVDQYLAFGSSGVRSSFLLFPRCYAAPAYFYFCHCKCIQRADTFTSFN